MIEYTPTVIVDFDGVIHSYESGWKGPRTIPDPPVDGAINFLLRLIGYDDIQPAILSTRSQYWFGRWAMKSWLKRHVAQHWHDSWGEGKERKEKRDLWRDSGFRTSMEPPDHEAEYAGKFVVNNILWPARKIPSVMQIDDRGFCFRGEFPSLEQIEEFTPWNKEE